VNDPFNVLISSGGRRVGLVNIFRETLRDLGLDGRVIVADMSPLSSAFHSADDGVIVPAIKSPEFIPTMLEICEREEVGLLIPTLDPELPLYARSRDAFAAIGTTVAISAPDAVAIGCDKLKTHAWLRANGFPTVEQTTVADLRAHTNGWRYPLLVKPIAGSASIGVAVVDDEVQLDAATRGGDYLVQSIAEGHEYTVDVLADRDGRCVCAIPRRRIEVRAGEVSKGMTERNEDLIALASEICETLPGAYGPLNIQIFLDIERGTMNVIEMNPRFSGGIPLSWQAGGKYPRWLIEDILGLPSTVSTEWRDRLVMLRWDDAVFMSADAAGVS
jgi:carbamoyl-phosphate synthase large subunit